MTKQKQEKPEILKVNVVEKPKSLREKRINELKKIDAKKASTEATFELLVLTNQRLEEIYKIVKGGTT